MKSCSLTSLPLWRLSGRYTWARHRCAPRHSSPTKTRASVAVPLCSWSACRPWPAATRCAGGPSGPCRVRDSSFQLRGPLCWEESIADKLDRRVRGLRLRFRCSVDAWMCYDMLCDMYTSCRTRFCIDPSLQHLTFAPADSLGPQSLILSPSSPSTVLCEYHLHLSLNIDKSPYTCTQKTIACSIRLSFVHQSLCPITRLLHVEKQKHQNVCIPSNPHAFSLPNP